MKNYYLNKVDKALRYLDYDDTIIDMFSEDEKGTLIRDEYLFLMHGGKVDCFPMSIEDMAESIIDYKKSKLCNASHGV
jgi:hypothetical protein